MSVVGTGYGFMCPGPGSGAGTGNLDCQLGTLAVKMHCIFNICFNNITFLWYMCICIYTAT